MSILITLFINTLLARQLQTQSQNITQQDQVIAQAKQYWNIQNSSCLQIQSFKIDQSTVDKNDFDDLTDEWTTYFTPLCQDTYQVDQFSQDTINQGFQNRTNLDFQTWFFKWYFRLGYMWQPQQIQPILQDYSFPWFRQVTKGVFPQLDQIGASFDDYFTIPWDFFQNFWLLYQTDLYPHEWLPITFEPSDVQTDEDYFCIDGYFLTEARECLKCPPGCFRCSQLNQCLECTTNFEMVRGDQFSYCFLGCFQRQYRQTQFQNTTDLLAQFGRTSAYTLPAIPPNEMMQTCKPCPDNCEKCYYDNQGVICTKCIDGWLGINGDCPQQQQTQTYLKFTNQNVHQCDDIIINLNTTDLRNIEWYVMTKDPSKLAFLEQLQLYFRGKNFFIIPNNFTEHMAQGDTIEVVLIAQNNLGIVKEVVIYKILQSPQTQIVASTKMLYFQAGNEFKLNLLYYYPLCPQFKYKPVVNDPQIQCRLLNQDHSVIQVLNNCLMQDDALRAGNTYSIQIDYKPALKQALKPQTHYVGVQTEQIETYCTFEIDFVTIGAEQVTTINPTYYGDMDLIDNYIWKCTINQKDACSLIIDQNQKQFAQLNTNSFVGKNVTIDLTIQTQIRSDAFNVSSCQITYEIVSQDVVPIEIISNPDINNYVDPHAYYQFECISADPVQIQLHQIQNGTSKLISSGIDKLLIKPYTLTDNKNYQLICTGQDNIKAIKNLTTNYFVEEFEFIVQKNSDSNKVNGFTQLITLEAIKQSKGANKTMKCYFGFYNEVGFVKVQDRSNFGKIFSTTSQSVDTVLPSIQGDKMQIDCVCYNSDGQKKVKSQMLTLKPTKDYFWIDTTNPRLSDIIISFTYHQQNQRQQSIDLIVHQVAQHLQNSKLDIDDTKQIIYMIKLAKGNLNNVNQFRNIIDKILNLQVIPYQIFLDVGFILSKYQSNITADYLNLIYPIVFNSIDRLDTNFTQLDLNNMILESFPLNKTSINQMGSIKISLGFEQAVKVLIPQEIVLQRYEDLKLVSMVTPTQMHEQKTIVLDSAFAQVMFVSNLTSLDIRTLNQPVQSVKLHNSQITILIPYQNQDDVVCVAKRQYEWQRLGSCDQSFPGYFACCTDSLTTFALVTTKVDSIDQSSNLALILIGVFVILLAIAAVILERYNLLIFGVKTAADKQNIELEQSVEPATPAKLSMVEQSSTKIDQEQSSNQVNLEQSDREMIDQKKAHEISINPDESIKQESIQVEISQQEKELQQNDQQDNENQQHSPAAKKRVSWFTIFCNVFIFQNRVISCICRHQLQFHRLVYVFTLAVQLMIGGALIVLFEKQKQKLLIAFAIMRPVQIFFNQIEKVKSNKKWIIRIAMLILLVVTTAVVAVGQARTNNSNQIIYLAHLEILVWDLFVLPLLIAIFAKRFPKWCLKYYQEQHN